VKDWLTNAWPLKQNEKGTFIIFRGANGTRDILYSLPIGAVTISTQRRHDEPPRRESHLPEVQGPADPRRCRTIPGCQRPVGEAHSTRGYRRVLSARGLTAERVFAMSGVEVMTAVPVDKQFVFAALPWIVRHRIEPSVQIVLCTALWRTVSGKPAVILFTD